MSRAARVRAGRITLKPAGRKMLADAGFGQAYEGSGTGRRMRGFHASSGGPNAVISGNVATIRRRVRQLVRNNPWARSGIDALVSECIGSGIKPMSQAVSADFQTAAQTVWNDWTAESDRDGLTTFYGLQALVAREFYEAGECFVRLLSVDPDTTDAVPVHLQLIEAEQVPVEVNNVAPNGNVIRQGIEFDPAGRRVAYHMYSQHPEDAVIGFDATQMIRVPAAEIVHIFKPLRAGQIRGIPSLAPVLVKVFDLDGYEDAELIRKKMAAMFAGFITSQEPDDASPVLTAAQTAAATEGTAEASLEAGTMWRLGVGESVEFSAPADLGGAYNDFLRWNLRGFAAGIGATYEQVTGDLTGVNFSSIRAGLLKFRRAMRMDQHQILAHQLCRPVWRSVINAAVIGGIIAAPGMVNDPLAWLRVKWMAEGWEWVDPVKEQLAEQSAVRNGFTSRRSVAARLGRDVDEIDQEIAEDNARADGLGLILDSDPRRTAKSGSAQALENSFAIEPEQEPGTRNTTGSAG
ncbi:MAG: phage portal protein [Minwuia sp.]|nr:phage portal protein [Minwuia sp.]